MRKEAGIPAEEYDRYVIQKGNMFLYTTHEERGKTVGTWTQYRYDAWHAMDETRARLMVSLTGGKVKRFNPVTNTVS